MTVTYHLQQPTRRLPLNGEETGRLPANRNGQPSLLLGLAPDGGYLAAVVAYCAGGLLHHLFTLTSVRRGQRRAARSHQRRYAFCGTVPSGRPAWLLASTALCGVRTFLIPLGTRLPDRLGCDSSILDCGASVNTGPGSVNCSCCVLFSGRRVGAARDCSTPTGDRRGLPLDGAPEEEVGPDRR